MRKLILLLAVAIAVAIGFSLSTLRASVSRGAEALAVSVADGTEGAVSVGDVSLSFAPLPVAEINDISVVAEERRGEEPEPVLEIPRLRVHPKVFPLLVGRVVVDSVEAIDAVLHARRAVGAPDFETFLPDDAAAKIAALGFPVSLTNATLYYKDGGRPQPLSVTVSQMNLSIAARSDSEVLQVAGTARPLGAASQATLDLEFEAGAGPTGGHRLEGSIDISSAETDAIVAALPLLGGLTLGESCDAQLTLSGLLGETSTEAAPAETFEIAAVGTTDYELLGRSEELEFDTLVIIDDRSVQLKNGNVSWAGISGRAGGWMSALGRKLSGRLEVDEIDVGKLMGEYGIDERWRPELVFGGVLKLTGHELEPLKNYEVTADKVVFAPYEGYEVVAGPTLFRGSLWASNAVFSISAKPETLRIGSLELGSSVIGSRYFRDKFTVTALDLPAWGGKSNASIVYYPKEQKALEVGGMVGDAIPQQFVDQAFPELGLEIDGIMDAIGQGGFNEKAPWSMGRIGFYYGEVGPVGVVNAVLTSISREAGASNLIDPGLVAKFPRTLAPELASFERIEMDYQTRDDGVALRSINMVFPHAEVSAEGLIEPDKTFAGWGVMTLSSLLTADIATRAPVLASLAGSDDRLRVPVKLQGGPSGAALTIDERFLDELRKAMRGGPAGPFVATEPQSELVMDMPTLREQFSRW